MKKILLSALFLSAVVSHSQNDCKDAIITCGNSGYESLNATGTGNSEELAGHTSCGGQETNSLWFRLNIAQSGTLSFDLIPQSNSISIDFDFYIFKGNNGCGNIGQTIRCSTTNPQMAGQPNNHTGLGNGATDSSEGPGELGDSYLKPLDVLAGETYFLVVDRPVGASNFSIEWGGTAAFNDPPGFQQPTATTLDIEKCDGDGVNDGQTTFDLTQNTAVIVGLQTGVSVSYHLTENDAITGQAAIAIPENFTNSSNPQTVYARIQDNTTGCFNYSAFELRLNSTLVPLSTVVRKCDDDLDGNDANGLVTFNMARVTSQLFNGQDVSGISAVYYRSQSNLDTATNPIGSTFYTTTPNSQQIYAKLSSAAGCSGQSIVSLVVDPLPPKKNVALTQCDTELNPDGLTLFNLNEADGAFTGTDPDLSVAYYLNQPNAVAGTDPLVLYHNISNPQLLVAKITNALTGCSSYGTLRLTTNVLPIQNRIIEECDDLGSEDGLTVFDLSNNGIALSGTQTIAYYLNPEDALLEQSPIANVTAFSNTVVNEQVIYARIDDGVNCAALYSIALKVNGLPKIKIQGDGDEWVCTDHPEQYIRLNAGLLEGLPSQFGYLWYLNGTVFPRYTNAVYVNQPGTYEVIVVNAKGCRKTRTIVVKPSNTAVISSVDIKDVTTENNTVTVNLSAQSMGNYEYALDAISGPYQDANVFEGVPPGFHSVYVRDKNGCGVVEEKIAVLGAPKFFTPNGDGVNDTWVIKGVDTLFNAGTSMSIFDRQGMLVKQVGRFDPSGWDGTFNGRPVPSDDYWYVVHFEDGRISRGHFTLKR